MENLFNEIWKERPVGRDNNTKIDFYLEEIPLFSMVYEVESLPFDCICWESEDSQLRVENEVFRIKTSAYSEAFVGDEKLFFADSVDILKQIDCNGRNES